MAHQSSTAVSTRRCPECESTVRTVSTETVCSQCGLVVETDELDRGPEWRAFNDSDRQARTRVGPANSIARHDLGMGAEIGDSDEQNDLGSPRSEGLKRKVHREAKVQSKSERNRRKGLIEIRRLTSALELGRSYRDRAAYLFRDPHDEGAAQGRSIHGLAAAAVYGAVRERGSSLSLDDVAAVATVETSDIKTAYGVLNREYGLAADVATPLDHVGRLASDTDVADACCRRAVQYAKLLDERHSFSGRDPRGLAAACVYRAAQDTDADVTQGGLADAADVSRATVRNARESLAQHTTDS